MAILSEQAVNVPDPAPSFDEAKVEVWVLGAVLALIVAGIVWLLMLVLPFIAVVLIAMALFEVGAIVAVEEQANYWQDEQDAERAIAEWRQS